MTSKSMCESKATPTLNNRPRLSLPGFKAAPRETSHEAPASQPARLPLPLGPVNTALPAFGRLVGLAPSGKLSKTYHARMTAELGQVLSVPVDALPPVLCRRVPLPLKIGIRDDLAARYPQADAEALGRWLRRWTNTDAYLVAVAAGGSRHDLDGALCGEIAEKEAAHARNRLVRRREASA